MPKRKLTDLAKEYNLSFENILEIASNNLEESSLSGRGKNTWVDETGQDVLDSNIPIEEPKPNKYRGRVRNKCPNPIYMMVHLKEKMSVVKTRIPRKLIGADWVDKMVTVEEIEENELYELVVPKIN
tara:strand:- start:3842 stop:4222 length:381 start_codon:yes stop_codon:yes gene_type:complete